jgi:hypothetical protein
VSSTGNPKWKKGSSANEATRWKPGQSGNPSGLPKGYVHVRELARQYTTEAIEALVEIVREKKHPSRVAAIKVLLERAWGAPEQKVELAGKDGEALSITINIKPPEGSGTPPATPPPGPALPGLSEGE